MAALIAVGFMVASRDSDRQPDRAAVPLTPAGTPVAAVSLVPADPAAETGVAGETATAAVTSTASVSVSAHPTSSSAPSASPMASAPPGYDGNGIRLVAPAVTVSGTTATFHGVVRAASPVRIAGVRFSVRTAGGGRVGDVAASGAVTVTSSHAVSAAHGYPGGTYTVAASYTVDGSRWVTGPAARFTVLTYDVNGVWLGPVSVSTSGGVTSFSAVLRVSRTVRFAHVQIAVRDSEGALRDANGKILDTGLTHNVTVTASRTVAGQRSYDPGTYRACLVYSMDGSSWVVGPKTTFTIA